MIIYIFSGFKQKKTFVCLFLWIEHKKEKVMERTKKKINKAMAQNTHYLAGLVTLTGEN